MSEDAYFNLIDEPWILVVDHAGQTREVSIRWIFSHATEVAALAHSMPSVNIAILRQLLAIAADAFEIHDAWSSDEAIDLWESLKNEMDQGQLFGESNGGVVDERLDNYLADVYPRFFLRHESAPFLQTPGLQSPKGEIKPLDIVIPDGFGSLFAQRTEAGAVEPAEAARLLVHCMAFDPSGIKTGVVGDPRVKAGKSYGIGVGQAGALGNTVIQGRNLGETLLYNLVPLHGSTGITTEWAGQPAWKLPVPAPGITPEENLPLGPLSTLTWPSRRIRLVWTGELVTGVVLTNGDPLAPQIMYGAETLSTWRFSEPQSKKFKHPIYMPRKGERGKHMWRSLDMFFPDGKRARVESKKWGAQDLLRPAANVQWITDLIDEGVLPSAGIYHISQVSMLYGTQDAVYDDLVVDSVGVPGSVLSADGDNARLIYHKAIDATMHIETALRQLARNVRLADSGDWPDYSYGDAFAAAFYHSIDEPFRHWLTEELSSDATLRTSYSWIETASNKADVIARQIVTDAGRRAWTSASADRNGNAVDVPRAYAWYQGSIRKLLPQETPAQETQTAEGEGAE